METDTHGHAKHNQKTHGRRKRGPPGRKPPKEYRFPTKQASPTPPKFKKKRTNKAMVQKRVESYIAKSGLSKKEHRQASQHFQEKAEKLGRGKKADNYWRLSKAHLAASRKG